MRTVGNDDRRAMIRFGYALGLLAAVAVVLAAACGSARAAEGAAPAWKVAAATGPTHLPPVQSEVQRLTVEAEGGTFTLSQSVTGEARRSFASAVLTFTEGSRVATYSGTSNPFEAGQEVNRSTASRLPLGAKVVAAETGGGAGSTVEFDTLPNSSGVSSIRAVSKVLSDVTATFYEGETVTGEGIPAATTVTAVDSAARTVTISNDPTKGGTYPLSTVRMTAPLPPDASAGEVQAALEALPGYGPGSVSVGGGPGGDAAKPFLIRYGGAYANEDVAQLVPDGSALTGARHYASVSTIVPGGAGTGELAVFPTNVGGAPSNGANITIAVALPGGFAVAGPVEPGQESSLVCSHTATEVTCETTEVVPATRTMPPVSVPVEVLPLAPTSAQATVTLSSNGVVAAVAHAPIVVSSEPAPFGIAAFWAGAFNAKGEPSTQAGGHPYSDLTWFLVNTVRSGSGQVVPSGDVKDVNVDLPAGFVGDPLVTANRCPQGAPTAEPRTVCEESEAVVGALGAGLAGLTAGVLYSPIANDVPVGGSAAQFSAKYGAPIVNMIGGVRSSEDFGIRVAAPQVPSQISKSFSSFVQFSGFPESAGGRAFFRNPTDCSAQAANAPVEKLEGSSWQEGVMKSAPVQVLAPVTGCDKLRFQPGFSLQPTSTQGSSGVGMAAHLHIDQSGLTDPNQLAAPDLKQSVVTLPKGFTVNPSQANGLEACSEAQVGYMPDAAPVALNPTRFDEDPVTCPDGSKLGTAEATSPLLEEPLKGTIYLARQEENPFHSLIALYLVFESPRFGITLKLPGKAELDPNTGQIKALFDYVPQQPVEDLTLHFRGGGPRSEFATPEVCGTYSTHGSWTPWSAPESGPPTQTSDGFTVSSGCSSSAEARPFQPSFEAGAVDPLAGAFTPLVINIKRNDGEQELKNVEFTLPPGMIAKLAGVPYCPEGGIASASSKSGAEEQVSPSCPSISQIGTVDVGAGVGSQPFHTGGKVYLAGPYEGAPLSAVVITPAVAGPFDLGNVVVRSPLEVDLETAQITAKSDPIPTILRGIPLKVRSIAIKVDRSGFSLNPTSCEAMSVTATLGSSDGATAKPANRFQVGGCEKLAFKPKLQLRLKGAVKRGGNPALRAVVAMPEGAANIARASVALPHSAFLDQSHIRTICTRVQFAAGNGHGSACPTGSIYGHVRAWSPLLDYALQGNVYLRSSSHPLPDLVPVLEGPAWQPLAIALVGRIDSKNGGIRTTFEGVPDAPVSKFVLNMRGGKKGLIVNSRNLCRSKARATVKFAGQNGKAASLRPVVKPRCPRKRKAHRRKGGGHPAKHKKG